MALLRKSRVEYWKSDFSAQQRRQMASKGVAMKDGSYPIPNAEYLGKAIKAVGRGTNNSHDAIRRHIISRARALGLSSRIPDDWKSGGTSTSKADDGHEPVVITKADAPMWTDADSPHVVYGVPLSPGIQDSQGDVVSAPEIEKTAHRWLVEYRKHDVQHNEQPVDAVPVESYIAPCDLMITGVDGEEQKVLKGAWVLAVKVNDEPTWDRVEKGELTGFSIGGSGVREEIPV